ncbi:PREDICTED: protein PTHB1 [Eufriesea mexicana]|uniref:protein PTHB1 n=1 Tax=Eufriesea mexicana TaxID=516756 RepID=UPI00083C76D2|nr:PREDICTED: protein PTHB1 [Eufriesea mexicana]
MMMEDGVRRLKTELFAFHGEVGSIYEIMQKTFLEEEKCGIMEMDILNMRYPLMVIQARSPYFEIIKNTALLLRETGLKYRDDNRLYVKKPKCNGQTSFVRIGFTECYFAIVAMCYGTLLSLVVLTAELVWHRNAESIDRAVLTFASNVPSFRMPCDGDASVLRSSASSTGMSLFKTKEWWRTRCGANESFDRHSLLVAPFFGNERKDILVVGSHEGYLRMYSPTSQWVDETKSPSNYKSTDLMIETRIDDCIVDMKAGKFVSGSQDLRLAVLSASKLLIYNVALVDESTEYGDRCELKMAYEHQLPKFPASLTTGPFGGVRGRDFLCVQCLDGTFLFYEQEMFAFSQLPKNRLLAEPIVYVARNDLFVTANSSWFLECHRHVPTSLVALLRYQSMAEWSRKKEQEPENGNGDERRDQPGLTGTSLEPDWTYNIGEAVLAIEAVTLSSFEVGIVVLGERHLFCLKDNCASVKYAKKLEYKPLCFRPYVIEPDGKLMVLVIADTSTLMIYEGSTVKWSAQLPFPPVTVARVQLEHLQAAIVVLSADGRLEACYLGTEPSLFVAPPLHPRGYDYADADRQLSELRAASARRNDSKDDSQDDRTSDAGVDAELIVSVSVSLDSESPGGNASHGTRRSEDDAAQHPPVCNLSIELSSYAILRDVQVCVDVCKPLVATDHFHVLPNLCERHVAKTAVYVDGDWPAFSSAVTITVSYRTDAGVLRALRRSSQLPLKTMLRSCPPETTSSFVTVMKSKAPLLTFAHLFPEFSADQCQRQGWNALGLRHVLSGQTVTVVSGNASNRYRVQSNDGLSSILVLHRLIERSTAKNEGSLATSIGQSHIRSMHQRIDDHFRVRREIERITDEIGLLTSQLRNIERKMLRAVRGRNERSLADTELPFLFDSTYGAIFALLQDLAKARAERERTGHEVRCSVELSLLLLRTNLTEDECAALRAAIGFEPRPADRFDWEEIADAGLTTLLEYLSRKTGVTESRSSKWNKLTPIASSKELTKLKTRLVHAIERLTGNRESDIAEIEPGDGNDLAST